MAAAAGGVVPVPTCAAFGAGAVVLAALGSGGGAAAVDVAWETVRAMLLLEPESRSEPSNPCYRR